MTTAAPKPVKPLRRAVGAVAISRANYDAWHVVASATPGLTELELGVLALVATSYRQLHERGHPMGLTHDAMARHLGVGDPDEVGLAVYRLRDAGLVGVQRRGSGRANTYAMTLPKRLAAALQVNTSLAAGDDDTPPF